MDVISEMKPAAPHDASTIDVLRSLYDQRRSCRAFLGRTVPVDIIRQIVELATRAPSGCNSQPWGITITSGEATGVLREMLSAEAAADPAGDPDFAWPSYSGVYRDRRRECALQLYDAVGIARDDREASGRQTLENFRFFGAPHVAIVSVDAALGTYAVLDTGAFVTSFLIAAQSLGIATVPQAALALYPKPIRRLYGMEDSRLILCGISFGYADEDHPANQFRTSRAGLDQILTLVS